MDSFRNEWLSFADCGTAYRVNLLTAIAISMGINTHSSGKPKSYLLLLFFSFSFFLNRKHWKKVLTKFLETFQS